MAGRGIAVLAGGVGGSRFVRGLARVVDQSELTVIVNTADDECFFGLHVSPDLDTVTYTLAGIVDRRRGFGVRGDTTACLEALGRYYPGGTWFRLGDRDLATHIFRTQALRAGLGLSTVTAAIARAHGVRARILPVTDQPLRTFIHTGRAALPFQSYLVRHGARVLPRRIEVRGARSARPAPGVLEALSSSRALIFAPSNPLVSIGPILAVPGVRTAIARRRGPVAAVCPLIGGRPVRGPADRMLRGIGIEVSPRGVARLYRGLMDVFVIDRADKAWAQRVSKAAGCEVLVTSTLMSTPARAERLARQVLAALEPRR